jgi:4-hydroxy-3-polyprenylbenzoate decarboxylase
LRHLLEAGVRTYLIFTETATKVVATEMPKGLLPALARSKVHARLNEREDLCAAASGVNVAPEALAHLRIFDNADLYAPIASGSEGATHMVVCPSSMGTVARIAQGVSSCLVERAADVMLKERRPLVVVPRETPFSLIHLRNLTSLAEAGAHVVPAMPAFYMKPSSMQDLIDFVVERALDALRIEVLGAAKTVRWNVRNL